MKRRRFVIGFVACAACACAAAPILFARMQSASQKSATNTDEVEPIPNWSDPAFANLRYDVVSVKPHKKDDGSTNGTTLGTRSDPDGFSAAFPVAGLIYNAWYTPHYRVSGASSWMNSEMYDVEARMSPETIEALQKLTPIQRYLARQHMLQVLLEDRFKVVVHVEAHEIPAYDLVVAKNGPKLKLATGANPNPNGRPLRQSISGSTEEFVGRGQDMLGLARAIEGQTDRPVNDKTGLTDKYDFDLQFTPDKFLIAADASGDAAPQKIDAPSITRALEDQLGLRLVPGHRMVNDIIIDHAERPTAN
jgi:uncharacterized protein (TIGR03435 family)